MHCQAGRRLRCARRCRAWRARPADRCRHRPRLAAPSLSAASASTPEPQPKSSTAASVSVPSAASESSHCRHRDVVGCVPEPKARPDPTGPRPHRGDPLRKATAGSRARSSVRAPKCSGTYWSIQARSQSWSSTVRKRACDQSQCRIKRIQRGEQPQRVGVVREQRAESQRIPQRRLADAGFEDGMFVRGVRFGVEQRHRQRADLVQRLFVAWLLGSRQRRVSSRNGMSGLGVVLGGAFPGSSPGGGAADALRRTGSAG